MIAQDTTIHLEEALAIFRDGRLIVEYSNHGQAQLEAAIETFEASKITLPVLIVQGSADRFVDPDSARMLYGSVGSVDKTIKIYDGLYHEVFNEPEHDQVLGDVEAWLEARI